MSIIDKQESQLMNEEDKTPGRFQCEALDGCSFFQEHQDSMPGLVAKLKSDYCLHDNTHCFRRWVRQELGPEAVPKLMMPHQKDWAEQILRDANKTKAIMEKSSLLKNS